MTVEEIKEALFKECAEALEDFCQVSNYAFSEDYDQLIEYKQKGTIFRTLFRLVADTLGLEDEYYEYKIENGLINDEEELEDIDNEEQRKEATKCANALDEKFYTIDLENIKKNKSEYGKEDLEK